MARRDALLRLHKSLTARRDELQRRLGGTLKDLRNYNSMLLTAFYDAELIKKEIKDIESSSVFYSFWMNGWALSLALLKTQKEIESFVFVFYSILFCFAFFFYVF